MGHVLVGLFGGGVQRNGMIDVVSHGEWQILIAAVHTGAGGVHQVFDAMVPTAFQHRQESVEIRFEIGKRVVERVPHACLRRQVDHGVELSVLKQFRHAVSVGTVHLDEFESIFTGQPFNPGGFEFGVVVRVEVVDPHHVIASVEKPMGCGRANKTSRTSDKNSHDFMLRHEVSWSGNEPYAFGRIFLRVDTAGRRPRVSRRGSGCHHKCEGLILYCLSISWINDV